MLSVKRCVSIRQISLTKKIYLMQTIYRDNKQKLLDRRHNAVRLHIRACGIQRQRENTLVFQADGTGERSIVDNGELLCYNLHGVSMM